MAITLSQLESVRYPPELIPSADILNVVINNRGEVMNIPRIPGNMLTRLHGIATDQAQAGQLRIKVDEQEMQMDNRPLFDMSHRDVPSYFDLLVSKAMRLHVYAIAGLVDYAIWFGVWAWKKTVADKILLGLPLTPDEIALDLQYGIRKTVERGTLPPKLDRTLLYEYYPIYEWTDTSRETIPAAGRIQLASITPSRPDRFVVLTRVSADRPAAAANATQIIIWRDSDGTEAAPFITLPTYALKGGKADAIPMFIPALTNINLAVQSTAGEADYPVRWTYVEYPLTTILRARFGLVSRDELPNEYKEVYDKVKGGIV